MIAAFGLAAAVLVSGGRRAAAAGAGFALSTLGGYLLSVWIGLFGFKEIRTTAGIVAGMIEVAAFTALATGTPAAGQGVTDKLGTFTRSDGTTQAVYNGHPLYTYLGDTALGQAHANNLNLNGGLWHEVTVSG